MKVIPRYFLWISHLIFISFKSYPPTSASFPEYKGKTMNEKKGVAVFGYMTSKLQWDLGAIGWAVMGVMKASIQFPSVCIRVCAYKCGAFRGQKRSSDPLELELQMVWAATCGYWDLSSRPLRERDSLTSEPSFIIVVVVHMCMHRGCALRRAHYSTHVDVRGQLCGAGSLLPLLGEFWGSHPGYQDCDSNTFSHWASHLTGSSSHF